MPRNRIQHGSPRDAIDQTIALLDLMLGPGAPVEDVLMAKHRLEAIYRPSRARMVEARSLGGVHEVLKLAAKIRGQKTVPRSTLALWRRPTTRPPFPRPVKRLKNGEVWDLAEVRAWLEGPRYVGDARGPKA